ncbi:MAG: HdeD family acid-resistance protein [Anaerolineae bacterium]|nr:HdeD family acid-resistance protein [Anaerolineae bacterium]MBX3066992.1 HdeD family acid-resistance protein [Anaerolineae bacterium]
MASLRSMWWGFLLRGVVAILFGIAAFVVPGLTIEVLVTLFGIFMLMDGIFAIVSVFAGQQASNWWITVIEGVIGVLLGIFAFIAPATVAGALVYVIAAWMIATGLMELLAAIRLRKVIENEFWLGLAGILSIVAGVFVVLNVVAGALAIIWAIGGYAIVFGIFMIMLAFRVRSMPAGSGAA